MGGKEEGGRKKKNKKKEKEEEGRRRREEGELTNKILSLFTFLVAPQTMLMTFSLVRSESE